MTERSVLHDTFVIERAYTEQGAFLDGFDGPDASSLRQGGTEEMLEGLAKYLA